MSVTVIHGDCLEKMRDFDANSIDSCVTDPPYGLSFMGRGWDHGIPGIEYWQEVFRVLKPGAHLVAFGGTRTYHRLVCAIEDAGFEVRDRVRFEQAFGTKCGAFIDGLDDNQRGIFFELLNDYADGGSELAWEFGQGFPKSHSVSLAIDKAGGISPREQAAILRVRREAAGMSRDDLAAAVGCTVSSVRDWEEGRARTAGAAVEWLVPSDEYRAKLTDTLGYSADERELIGIAIDRRADGTVIGLGHSGELRRGGITNAARQWEGWGTALKPAHEPIVLARKPLSEGTVAANVLKWGTGALNIDGCRVESGSRPARSTDHSASGLTGNGGAVTYGSFAVRGSVSVGETNEGRWPANVIHDNSDAVVSQYPQSAGQQGDLNATGRDRPAKTCYGDMSAPLPHKARGDAGSAARFFYAGRANKADRAGSKHPTIKPISILEWLVTLITPPGGTVLDPFAGSGTTGAAARNKGFNCVLIEREAEYVADINRRLAMPIGTAEPKLSTNTTKTNEPADLGPLFAGMESA